MSIIKWTEALQIGIDQIDEQHRYLINLINELHLAVEYNKGSEVILPMLAKLHQYANTHFREEEALLEKHDYPGKVDHAEEHREFIGKLEGLRTRYESADLLTVNVRNFLLSWFFNHIRLNDLEYRKYLEGKQVIPKKP